MFTLNHSAGRTVLVNGHEYLFFSGYSYLGISHVPEFIALVKEGLDKYGVLHPSSRISNTQLNIFEEMEAMLSHLTSQEETVIYSSGFLAGRAVVDLLARNAWQCYIAPFTHPALQNNTAITLNDNWQHFLPDLIEQSTTEHVVIMFDSVNPLTATINDGSFLLNLPRNKKIVCVIDDSHGIGLLGEKGEGISAMLPRLANVEYIITYSLSKAFHINGGAISCSKKTAALLKQSPFYTASTSIAPSLCYAFIKGQHVYNLQREKLYGNMALLQNELSNNSSVHYHQQLPLVILSTLLNEDYFTKHKIIISSFAYPNPSGDKINRIVLSALHTGEDIKLLCKLIKGI